MDTVGSARAPTLREKAHFCTPERLYVDLYVLNTSFTCTDTGILYRDFDITESRAVITETCAACMNHVSTFFLCIIA